MMVHDVGRPPCLLVVAIAVLDNYSSPLATRRRTVALVSVWCCNRHAANSRGLVVASDKATAPTEIYTVRTTASTQTRAYKEQIRSAVSSASEIAPGPVQLQLGYVVGPQRNWTSLWKPTIDALDPPLGRTREDRDWPPQDGDRNSAGSGKSVSVRVGLGGGRR